MTNNNLFPQTKYTEIIDKPATIYITKKTVQFDREVYQFSNITGFAVTKRKAENLIPISWLLVLFVLGLMMASIPNNNWVGIIMVILALLGIFSNFSQPQRYGLGLYLNSGHERIFITSDIKGLKGVVAVLYEYMDSDEEKRAYVVNIVAGNVTGNFIGGDARNNNLNFQ
jgi:hypothetical protein